MCTDAEAPRDSPSHGGMQLSYFPDVDRFRRSIYLQYTNKQLRKDLLSVCVAWADVRGEGAELASVVCVWQRPRVPQAAPTASPLSRIRSTFNPDRSRKSGKVWHNATKIDSLTEVGLRRGTGGLPEAQTYRGHQSVVFSSPLRNPPPPPPPPPPLRPRRRSSDGFPRLIPASR